MSAKLKPWLVLASIFVAGALSGAALTMVLGPHFEAPPGGPQGQRPDMQKMWMLRLTHELKLTDDQQAKIEPILRDTADKVQKNHREEFDKVSQLLKASDDQIAALLTPEQRTELQKMSEERDKAFTRHMHQWDGPPRDGGHDGGPDGGGRPDHPHFHPGPNGGPSDQGPGQAQTPPGQPPPPAPPTTNAPGK
jgi:Spy/CpxP family protein refolding chaperone